MRRLFFALVLATACSSDIDDNDDTSGVAADDSATDVGDDDDDVGDDDDDDDDGPVVHEVDVSELKAWLDEGRELLLINTHVPRAGEIPGTDVHISYLDGDELIAEIGDDLDRLTVVYCKTGPMSAAAADDLVAAGYTAIHDLPGGMNAWEAAGYELTE